jgi:hypothetical protein
MKVEHASDPPNYHTFQLSTTAHWAAVVLPHVIPWELRSLPLPSSKRESDLVSLAQGKMQIQNFKYGFC